MDGSWRVFTVLILFLCPWAHAKGPPDVGFEQKTGASLSSGIRLWDEAGRPAHLAQYYGHKPIILSFVYFGCPNLCTLVLNGIVDSINSAGLRPGRDVDLLSISINPDEKPGLALAKKRAYLARLSQTGDENPAWHFLTGPKEAIQALTAEAGFHFKYDPDSREYNHPSGFLVLTPSGEISRYFFGIRFDQNELKNSLAEAALGKSRKTLAEVILNCFHYDPESGRNGRLITRVLRWMSLATVFALGGLFAWLGLSRRRAAS